MSLPNLFLRREPQLTSCVSYVLVEAFVFLTLKVFFVYKLFLAEKDFGLASSLFSGMRFQEKPQLNNNFYRFLSPELSLAAGSMVGLPWMFPATGLGSRGSMDHA